MKEPCDWYAATQKQGKHDASLKDNNNFFGAIVFERLGALYTEGEDVF